MNAESQTKRPAFDHPRLAEALSKATGGTHKALDLPTQAKNPWYDITRVGIYGGSAGGQNALGALLFHPDFYKVAVSYAGCHDNRMDKI